MAGIKELVAKVKIDKDFAKSLKDVKSLEELWEKVKDAGFEVTLNALKDALGEMDIIPEGLLDKLPDSLDIGDIIDDALESDALKDGLKDGLKKLGKFF